ncbi:glycosyltransferase [Vibrio splendidus]|uniref:glycosyltransferase n=1 Tax=Vibrio splendidus TaxID=29497 RepID=UPI0039A544C6
MSLDKFDLYAIFSRSESFGVSALEASARGVPVVSSNVGGLPEVVCNDVTGEVLDTNNLDSMALSLSNLLNNEDKRAFLSKNGPGFVENNYSSLVMDKAFSVALDFSQNT